MAEIQQKNRNVEQNISLLEAVVECFRIKASGSKLSKLTELRIFCDASETVYEAVKKPVSSPDVNE